MSKNKDIKLKNAVLTCVAVEKSDIERIDAVCKTIGINRSEFFRSAIVKELLLQEGIAKDGRVARQVGSSYAKHDDQAIVIANRKLKAIKSLASL